MVKLGNKKTRPVGRPRSNDENILRTYLKEVTRIPLISKEEEKKIALLAVQGDKAAREHLVNSNLRFVVMIAKKYQGKGLPLEDLIAEGNLGLLSSIDHFDVKKGCRFITYAVWWIRQAIIKALHEKSRMIRLPSNKSNEVMKIERTRQTINNEQCLRIDSESNEIAAFLNVSRETVDGLLSVSHEMLSLDDPISPSNDSMLVREYVEDIQARSPLDNAINNLLKEDLEKILNSLLGKRAAEVIRCRYGLGNTSPMTLKEIGDRYKLSRERVRQIEKRALTLIKDSKASNELEIYTA